MANTKVTGDLIADGTITTGNLANSSVTAAKLNSITTDNITEGTNLFYTDARVGSYLSGSGYDTATNIIATITDSAPTTLDTLNELAAALGDDPNFATTVTNSIATKLPLAGGNITGDLSVNTNTLFVDVSSGNVGIGTSSPATKLDLDDGTITDIRIRGNRTTDDRLGGISFYNTPASDVIAAINVDRDGANDAGAITFDTQQAGGGNTERMRVTSAGNVGIGTSNPVNRLDVNGNARSLSSIIDDGSDQGNFNANSRLKISRGPAPSYIQFISPNNQEQGILFGDPDDTVSGSIRYDHPGDYMWFEVNNSEKMRISSSGNVGIGTTSPAATLHVNGSTTIGGADVSFGHFKVSDQVTNNSIDYGSYFGAGNGGIIAHFAGIPGSQDKAIIIGDSRYASAGANNVGIIFAPSSSNNNYWDKVSIVGYNSDSAAGNASLFIDFIQNFTSSESRRYGFNLSAFYPVIDNALDLGRASNRWDDVYATNTAIQGSDKNLKQDIEELNEAEKRVALKAKSLLRKYRLKSSVEKKGDNARIHFGIIAQDLEQAFQEEGLDAGRYGMFVRMQWYIREDGTPIVDGEMDKEDMEKQGTLKEELGIRYTELLAFIIAAL